jgi:hypothetical protein
LIGQKPLNNPLTNGWGRGVKSGELRLKLGGG